MTVLCCFLLFPLLQIVSLPSLPNYSFSFFTSQLKHPDSKELSLTSQARSKPPTTGSLHTISLSFSALITIAIFHLFRDYWIDVSLHHQTASPWRTRTSLLCSWLYPHLLAQPMALSSGSEVSPLLLGKKTQVTMSSSAPSSLVS